MLEVSNLDDNNSMICVLQRMTMVKQIRQKHQRDVKKAGVLGAFQCFAERN